MGLFSSVSGGDYSACSFAKGSALVQVQFIRRFDRECLNYSGLEQ